MLKMPSAVSFRIAVVEMVMVFVFSGFSSPVKAQQGNDQDLAPVLDGGWLDKGNAKLDSHLNQLISSANNTQQLHAIAQQSGISADNNSVRVVIESIPGLEQEVASLAQSLGQVENTYGEFIQVRVPVTALNTLASANATRFVRLPYQPMPEIVISEGVGLIGAGEWQSAGYDGTGVKVAILDTGFQGYSALLGTELPASVVTQSFSGDITGGGQVHGTACAEIVHDVAPGAQLYLVNFSTEVEFGNAIDWLISQGVTIISSSVGWPAAGPGDGTGPINAIVSRAKNAGILWCQSAGNNAQKHWSGGFADFDGDNWADFERYLLTPPNQYYVDEIQIIQAVSGQVITAYLTWDEPWGSSSNDYDLFLTNDNSEVIWGSENIQNGSGYPYESFSYTANYTGEYGICIYANPGTAARNFHLFASHDLEDQTKAGSIIVPGDSDNVLTVGAVPWNNSAVPELFSSQGPTADGRSKPNVVAPDAVSTSSYGAQPFYGTSASAPCAAGAAALVKQKLPEYNPTQLLGFFQDSAVDIGKIGKDNTSGHGGLYLGEWKSSMINETSTAAENPSITVDSSGRPHIVYRDTANADLWHSYWDGTTWQTEQMGSLRGTVLSSALDSKDYVHVAYISSAILRYAYCDLSGWHDQILDPTINSGHPALALDDSDRPYVIYSDNNRDLKYIHWDGYSWNSGYVEETTASWNSLVIDAAGNPNMSYYDSSSGDLKFAKWNGSNWQISVIDSEGDTGYRTSITLDTLNNAHISYYDATDNEIKYAYSDGSQWHLETVDSVTTNEPTEIMLDQNGIPHIVYVSDSEGGLIKYAEKTRSSWSVHSLGYRGNTEYFSAIIDNASSPETIHIAYKYDDMLNGGNGDAIGLRYTQKYLTLKSTTVTTNEASDITKNSARLNGNLTSFGYATSANVSFEWGLTTGYGNTTTPQTKTSIGSFSTTVTSLSPNTTYHFRAKAVGEGTSLGEDKTFTTLSTPPSVTTGSATANFTSARLSGSVTSMGTATSVTTRFVWGIAQNNLNNTIDCQTLTNTGSFSGNITGLTPGATYYYQAQAVGQGTGRGTTKSFVTLSTPPTVATDNASNVGHFGAQLNGNLAALGSAPSVNVSFQWGTRAGNYSGETAVQSIGAAGSFYTNLAGLSENTTYYYRAKAVGHGTVYGAEKSFKTLADGQIPTAVTDNATNVGYNAARLNCTVTSMGTVQSAAVYFVWGTAPGVYTGTSQTVPANGTGLISLDVGGFSASTVYYYRAHVSYLFAPGDGGGFMADGEKTFMTSEAPPPPSYGGGGFGGGTGGGGVQPGAGVTNLGIYTNSEGLFNIAGEAESEDGKVFITIGKGVVAQTKDNTALKSLKIVAIDSPGAAPAGSQFIGLIYELTPDGATFTPGITLTLFFDPAAVPAGIDLNSLKIAVYNTATSTWEILPGIINKADSSITVNIGHFSIYAIVGSKVVPPTNPKLIPLPAKFATAELAISPVSALPGQSVEVSTKVSNTGETAGEYEVVLKVNGTVEETRKITVGAKSSAVVTFNVTRSEPGSYDVNVNGANGSFTIQQPPPVTTAPVETDEHPIREKPGTNWLIAGLAIGAVAAAGLMATVLVVRRRKGAGTS